MTGMKAVFLFVGLAVSATSSKEIDLNNLVDENISRIGNLMRKLNLQSKDLELSGYANLDDKYSFSQITIMGFDYWRRTGDCKLIKEEKNWNYKLNVGSAFLVIVIPGLSFNDEEMSAVFRVRNNSLYVSFDQTKGTGNVSVKDLAVTSLSQVEFWSSSPKYEGADVENIFDNARKFLNDLLHDNKILWNIMGKELWSMLVENYPKGIFNEL